MATANDAYQILMSRMGTEGGEPYWSWYFGTPYRTPSGTPYCACGVSWVLAQAGVESPFFPRGYAHDWGDDLGGRGVDRSNLQFMDAVSFDWDKDGVGDHEGFFLRYLGDGLCETAEFNTGRSGGYNGGQNKVCVRYVSSIICGIRPYYDEEDIVTEKDKKEIAEMAANLVITKLSAKNANGVPKVAELVLGARNKSLETVDFYQIVRDIRNALGISDGQLLPTEAAKKANTPYEKSVIAKIAAKLGVK